MKSVSIEGLRGLKKHQGGLSEAEVLSQRNHYGFNDILETSRHPFVDLLFDTIKDPMIWFLVGIGCVFLIIGNLSDGITLFVAVLPLMFMDAVLHWRTKDSVADLKGQLYSKVQVLRGAREIEIDSRDLVPGDIINVGPGVLLPADGVFERAHEIQIDESALTGEALPIVKRQIEVDLFDISLQPSISVEPYFIAFAGTRVLTGRGTLRVLLTGINTSYGEIVQSIVHMPQHRTPLQTAITRLVTSLIFASGLICFLLAGIRIYQGHSWLDALLSAATLAVAAIPEEFPIVFTFYLGVGIYRLAKKRVLVRRAVSIENIGRITQICTDKTGTITAGRLKLTHLDPKISIHANELLQVALAASSSSVDPADIAVKNLAQELQWPQPTVIHTVPFTEDRKRETGFVRSQVNGIVACIKGSPETLLAMSNLSSDQKIEWKLKVSKWASAGHKVMACAQRYLDLEAPLEEPTSQLEFCGLIIFEDPIRPEVPKAIDFCIQSGIQVMMITGDHPETAIAIAREAGLFLAGSKAISAEENPEIFEKMWLEQNPNFLKSLRVISRCTPIQKYRVVTALQKAGEIVAVTGDGVNDVPALKAADIGIAMGNRGTKSAKDVSSIILVDDNFNTIVNAIREGRQLFENIRTSFEFLLLIHLPLVLSAAVIPLLGYPLVFLPVHIVWLELIIHPISLLAFQTPEGSVDDHQGPAESRSFFSKYEILNIGVTGLLLTIFVVQGFITDINLEGSVELARSKVMALLVIWSASLAMYLSRFKNKAARFVVGATLFGSLFLIQISDQFASLHVFPLSLVNWVRTGLVVVLFLGSYAICKRSRGR